MRRAKLNQKAQAIAELIFFIPVFLILFVVHFWFQWAINGSIVHQQHTRGQALYLMRNSPVPESRMLRFGEGIETQPIRNNNFYVGYTASPIGTDNKVDTIAPEYWAYFSPDSFANPMKIKVRTVFGLCTGTLWNTQQPVVLSESSVEDHRSQDPHDLCR